MTDRPTAMAALREAHRLLQERGWTPRNRGGTFGPDSGRLSVLNALWRASCYGPEGECVYPPAAGKACELLGRTLGLQGEVSFVDLGEWCRAPRRTQEQVLDLFDRTIRAANRRRFAAIVKAGEEDEAPAEADVEAARRD
jgi:hypothetical protein